MLPKKQGNLSKDKRNDFPDQSKAYLKKFLSKRAFSGRFEACGFVSNFCLSTQVILSLGATHAENYKTLLRNKSNET